MKKYLLLTTLLIISSFVLVGCGSAKASESAETVKIAYLPITHSLAALEEAEELALTMIDRAKRAGRGCTAVISDMEQPLGITVGNTLEVEEAARFLRNEFRDSRLNDLVLTLCTEMYILAKDIDKSL